MAITSPGLPDRQPGLRSANQVPGLVGLAAGIAGEGLADGFDGAGACAFAGHDIAASANDAALAGADFARVRANTCKAQCLVSGRERVFQPARVCCSALQRGDRLRKLNAMGRGALGEPCQRNIR